MNASAYLWRLVFAGCTLLASLAGTWTQYRGSNHDGVSNDPIRLDWNERPPQVLWKVFMPNGLSSFTVDSGRLYTMGARQSANGYREFCIALDSDTGRELWEAPVGEASYPNGGVGSDDGTRGTPTVSAGRVYAFGAYLDLVCLEASSGAEIWRHDLRSEFGSVVIPWQNAASPLLVNDLILVNGNGRAGEHILAFRKEDGTLAWKTGSDGMTQSTPVAATIGGVEQAIFFAQSGLVGVGPADGRVLWRYPIAYNGTSVAASPVVVGDTVYASRAYPTRAGAVVVRLTNSGASFSASRIWEKQNQLMNHWATPVFYGGYYYGIYGQGSLNLRAVDANNGETKWMVSGFGYGSVTRVSDKLLVLGDDGTLALVEANPQAYTELARISPLEGRCWNNPAVSEGRIYIRSTTEAVALDVSVPSQANTTVSLSIEMPSPDELNIVLRNPDGNPLDENAGSALVVTSSELLGAGGTWKPVEGTAEITDGKIVVTTRVPQTRTVYFRAEAKP